MAAQSVAPLRRWKVGSHVNSVAISHDGTHVASGSDDDLVRIWDVRTSLLVLEPLRGHTSWVSSVAWSHDDIRVASGSHDNTICIWDARTGAPTCRPLTGHTNYVLSVSFSHDSTRIVSCSRDCTIRIWDYTGASIGNSLRGHTGYVHSASFSSDNTRIVSGSEDKTIRIWDALTGCLIGEPLRGHAGSVLSVAFLPDNTSIISGSRDKTIRMWDTRTGAPNGEPILGHIGTVWSVASSPDSTRIVSGSGDGTICVWDARTHIAVGQPLRGHTNNVLSVAFSDDGTHIISGSGDRTICAWEAPPGTPSFDMVTSEMSIQEMFDCLVQNGCTDLSSALGNGQYSSLPIDNGGFGDVWRVTLSDGAINGCTVLAVKTLRLKALLEGNSKAAKRAAREVHHWSKLQHPGVQELMGIVVFHGGLGMVSPWLQHGHIQRYLGQHPEVPRYPLCIQLASGISYLHSVNMNNVLVSDDGILKINDFDHAVLAESTLDFSTTTRPGGGTLRWMAPELLQSDEGDGDGETRPEAVRSKETDVYALAMTMLEILTGNVPYYEYQNDMGVYHAIHTQQPPERPQELSGPDHRANPMWELLLRCWDHNPSARPSAESVLAALRSFAA